MYDFKSEKKVRIPKDINPKNLEDLDSLLKIHFDYNVSQLIEYDIDKDWNIALTFFDWEDFIQDYCIKKRSYYKKLKRLLEYYFTKKSWFRFINIVEFNKQIKKADDILSGIDYLRISLDSPLSYFQDILDKLDYDNSNMYIDTRNYITWTKFRLKFWPCIMWSIVYEGVSIPILLYNQFDENRQSMYKSFGKIDYYGSYWRLLELWYLEPNLVETLIKSVEPEDLDILEFGNITRLDYKIDLMFKEKAKIPHFKNILKIRKNANIHVNDTDLKTYKKSNWEVHYKWENIQSWWYGSKEAKRVFLRVYDKLADTESKWKYMLYPDYFNYESVYRIEFELLNHFCKGFKYVDYNELVEKFWNSLDVRYMWKVFYNYNQEPNLEKLEQRIRYFKDFIGRWEKIAERGFNPFITLYKGLQGKNWKITEDKLVDLVYNLYEYVWNEVKKWNKKT